MLYDLGWPSLELRRSMTRLTLLYKKSHEQIDVDVNTYLRPHTDTERRLKEAIITHTGKIRQLRTLIFIPFFQGLLDFGIAYPLKLQRVTH